MKVLTIRLTDKEHQLLKIQAAKYGLSMKAYLLKTVEFDKLIDDSE